MQINDFPLTIPSIIFMHRINEICNNCMTCYYTIYSRVDHYIPAVEFSSFLYGDRCRCWGLSRLVSRMRFMKVCLSHLHKFTRHGRGMNKRRMCEGLNVNVLFLLDSFNNFTNEMCMDFSMYMFFLFVLLITLSTATKEHIYGILKCYYTRCLFRERCNKQISTS